MAQVALIASVLVLFIQLASSQLDRACTDAINTLGSSQCNDDNVCRNPQGRSQTLPDGRAHNFSQRKTHSMYSLYRFIRAFIKSCFENAWHD